MAPEVGSQSAALAYAELLDELSKNPSAFEFFQAVLHLERLRTDREPVGRHVDPAREVVRFSSHRSIAFPPAEIAQLKVDGSGAARMTVNVMGVTGPLGVLPLDYTLLAAERAQSKDPALAEFLDLFHHRVISLFYRAWKKNRSAIVEDPAEDHIREHLWDLAGVGLREFREALGVEENALAYYAGLLAGQRRSAVTLEQLLGDYFGVQVEVQQFVGGWFPLPADNQCALGEDAGPSTQLGLGAVVGGEFWEQQSRIRIRIGPLSRAEYDDFLPTGKAYGVVRELTRYFSNDEHEFELQLVLAREEVAGPILGGGDVAQPLGWSTWLTTGRFDREADETVLRLS